MNLNLTIGQEYSKEEIENAFDTKFGAFIKGIILRRWHDNTPYIILFSRADGPYSDKWHGETFTYIGEGLRGDQKLTTANRILRDSDLDSREIFGFRQEDAGKDWGYVGKLRVVGCDYVEKGGRKVYEYKLQKVK